MTDAPPAETRIALTRAPGDQHPAITINGEAATDVVELWLTADGPNGLKFALHRMRIADGQEWHASHEYDVTEVILTAKVVRRG